MRVVITGASGNVGTSLLESLAGEEQVSEIVGVARRLPQAPFAKTRWRAADITTDDLAEIFRGADAVVHLAWLIQPSRDERTTHRVNVEGSARVFDAVARAGVPALVYASSIGTYAPKTSDDPVDESWPATGIATSFYSRHKATVEQLLDGFERLHPDVRVARLRPALIFKRDAASEIRRLFIGPFLPGAAVRPELLPALPFPRGLRTQAVHSSDIGEAYRAALVRPVSGAFNIAADPVLDAHTVRERLGLRPLEVPPRALRTLATLSWRLRLQPTSAGWLDMGMQTPVMDCSRAHTELGWHPAFGADDAVKELIAGLREQAAAPTPPLARDAGGPLRLRELLTGVGGRS